MKNKLKHLVTCAALITSTFTSTHVLSAVSAAEDVIGTFQWVGTVAPDVPGIKWKIINSGLIDHLSGTVAFSGTSGAYEIVDSSELRFQVIDTGNSNTPAVSFDYNLTSLRFSAGGGFMTDANGEFTITGDGSDLIVNTLVNKTGSEVALKVTTPAATNVVSSGDEVVIQAVILVNNQT